MLEALKELIARLTSDPYLQAGIVFIASFLFAYVVSGLIKSVVLPIVGKVSRTTFDDDIVKLLHGPIVKTIVLTGLAVAANMLALVPKPGEAVISAEVEDVTIKILWTIGILVWMVFTFKASHRLLLLAKGRTDKFAAIEPRTFPLFDNLGKVLIFAITVYVLIRAWGADPTGWLASAGIVGLALSFAAQDSLANLFAGVFIIADAPYKVGDYINLESGERGKVSHIGLRSTRLLTRDDIEVTIPNSVMGKARIVNETAGPYPKHRVGVKVGVAYGSDVDVVREALLEAGRQAEHVCADPEPRVRFRLFGESSLDFELLCWIPDPEFRGRVLDALNTSVYKQFARDGIKIPFPQRDLYIKEMPGAGAVQN